MWIDVVEADITRLQVDAIVNAGAPPLLGGGGVDGAIHRAAGPRLLEACRALPEVSPGVRCRVGDVRVTPGFDLPARYVIHTVGPVWQGGDQGEAAELAACYRHAIRVATGLELRSIAFPAISCGVYGYPVAAASAVAVASIHGTQARDLAITLCCFNTETANAFRRAVVT